MITHMIILIVDIFLLFVISMQILANFAVLLAWGWHKRLRANDSLILLVSLAFIDFVYALLQFPLLLYLILNWKPADPRKDLFELRNKEICKVVSQQGTNFNYDAAFVFRLGGPSAALMKSGCTVTTFIAVDRVVALYWPTHYYRIKKRWPLIFGFFISILLAFLDWLILQLTVDIKPEPECSSFGCFTNKVFRAYWGLSNMFMNLFSCILTVVIVYCLVRTSKSVRKEIERQNKGKIDRSANRVAIYILLVSALIGVVPGCLNGVGTIVEIPILDEVSFFVGTCATLSGLSHAFIFAMAHREIKHSIWQLIATLFPCCCFAKKNSLASEVSMVSRTVRQQES